MYTIAIGIEGMEKRRRSCGLLHIVVGFFLIAKSADYFRFLQFDRFIYVFPFIAVASASLFYGFFRRKVDPAGRLNLGLRLLQTATFAVLGILMMRSGRTIDYAGPFIWAALSLVLFFSERRIFDDTELLLNEAGIHIPGYYRVHLVRWTELTDVIVRQDFVTIFHRDQKFLQYRVDQSLTDLELAKLNAFCREQIEKVGQQEQANA